jgi:cell division septum initiation protein DivIVA
VAAFVEELLARNKQLADQGAAGVMVNYTQKLMGELQELEATIRAQAQRDAQVEAVKITADAQRQAQETIQRARGEATAVAQRQAEAILAEARKKAELAESQVRIQAQFMLAKARDQIQAHIQREGEIAYQRMMSALTGLIQEAQRVESEWKEQTARLWQGEEVRLAIGPIGLSTLPILGDMPQAAPPARS